MVMSLRVWCGMDRKRDQLAAGHESILRVLEAKTGLESSARRERPWPLQRRISSMAAHAAAVPQSKIHLLCALRWARHQDLRTLEQLRGFPCRYGPATVDGA